MNDMNDMKRTNMYLEETSSGKGYISDHKGSVGSLIRTFTLSCDHFGGFTCVVNVSYFDTVQDIINYVLTRLRDALAANHLDRLVDKLHHTWYSYHIHDYNICNILVEDREYYICNHGCQ